MENGLVKSETGRRCKGRTISCSQLFECCFKSKIKLWAVVVSYVDLGLSILSVVYALKHSIVSTKQVLQRQSNNNGSSHTHDQLKTTQNQNQSALYMEDIPLDNPFSVIAQFDPSPKLYLSGTLLVFTISIILLVGIHMKKPDLILVWVIGSYFEIVVNILLCFVSILSIGTRALFYAILLAFKIFSIWVVHLHREELIQDEFRIKHSRVNPRK